MRINRKQLSALIISLCATIIVNDLWIVLDDQWWHIVPSFVLGGALGWFLVDYYKVVRHG